MVCGRSVPVQALEFELWRSACSSCGSLEVNMSADPGGITSADAPDDGTSVGGSQVETE
jgi:hypothetical protein